MNDQPDTKNDNNDRPPVAPSEPTNPVPQPHQQPAQQQPYPPQPYAPAPQGYPGQPGMAYAPMENPGQTLGIVGLILNFFGISIAGIILGVMSRNKSKAVGMSTALGTISLVWGIITTVIVGLIVAFWIVIIALAASNPGVRNSLENSSTGGSSSNSSTYESSGPYLN